MERLVRENEIKDCCITHLSMGQRSNLSLLVYTQDSIVRNFETKVMVPSQRYVGAKCTKYRMEAAFSPDAQFVFAGSETGSVMLWSVKGSDPVPVIQWNLKFSRPVTSIAWNPKVDTVAFTSFGPGQSMLVFTDSGVRASQRRARSSRASRVVSAMKQ
jgi:jouberin